MKRPKVLVVSTSKQTRGGITAVVKSHEACPHWLEYNCRWLETHIDKSPGKKLWYFVRSLVQFICVLPAYQIVHIHLSEPVSAIRKSLYIAAARCFRKKVIVHFHAFSPDTTLHGRFKFLYRWMFRRADAVVALSGYWKTEIEKVIGASSKIKVIYNPCPIVKKPNVPKEKQILFAGTMNERKGYADLIEAFASIADRHRDWKVVFAGNGELNNAMQLISKRKIGQQVQLLGWVSGTVKSEAFTRASVFCLPSYAEGFPMAVLDAWAYALPVVCTPVGGLPEIVQDGKNALLFECGDIKGLARQLDKILSDVSLRESITEQSSKLAQDTFDQFVIGRQIAQLYQELSTQQ